MYLRRALTSPRAAQTARMHSRSPGKMSAPPSMGRLFSTESAREPPATAEKSFFEKWLPAPRALPDKNQSFLPRDVYNVRLSTVIPKEGVSWLPDVRNWLEFDAQAQHSGIQFDVKGDTHTYEATSPGENASIRRGRVHGGVVDTPAAELEVTQLAMQQNLQKELEHIAIPWTASEQVNWMDKLARYAPETEYGSYDLQLDLDMANKDAAGRVPYGQVGAPYSLASAAGSVLQQASEQQTNPLKKAFQYVSGTILRFTTNGDCCSDIAGRVVGQGSKFTSQTPDKVQQGFKKR